MEARLEAQREVERLPGSMEDKLGAAPVQPPMRQPSHHCIPLSNSGLNRWKGIGTLCAELLTWPASQASSSGKVSVVTAARSVFPGPLSPVRTELSGWGVRPPLCDLDSTRSPGEE